MRDHGHFLGKAFDMLCLTLEIGERYEDREIGVGVAGCLDPVVQQALHALPYAVAPGPDDHAASHTRFFGHFGSADDFLVPGCKIIVAPGVQGMAYLGHVIFP